MDQPKYSRDGPEFITLGEVVRGMADLIDGKATDREVCDFLDEKFFEGCYSNEFSHLDQPFLVLRDLRGLIIDSYREGIKRATHTKKE